MERGKDYDIDAKPAGKMGKGEELMQSQQETDGKDDIDTEVDDGKGGWTTTWMHNRKRG